ncbi:MAG: circularly permuted type 2 ATP-grasp protein, partial [Deltaproteobacteria bacterium]
LAQNPEWLRPLVGLNPRGEEFLYYLAFDLGRDRSGRWLVLSDRVQAPSGIAFALENRVATTRVFTEIFQKMPIYRLAPFFGKFRKMLQGLNPVADGLVAILSPGPMNEGYFEHTY